MSRVMECIRFCRHWRSSVDWRPAAAEPSLPMSLMPMRRLDTAAGRQDLWQNLTFGTPLFLMRLLFWSPFGTVQLWCQLWLRRGHHLTVTLRMEEMRCCGNNSVVRLPARAATDVCLLEGDCKPSGSVGVLTNPKFSIWCVGRDRRACGRLPEMRASATLVDTCTRPERTVSAGSDTPAGAPLSCTLLRLAERLQYSLTDGCTPHRVGRFRDPTVCWAYEAAPRPASAEIRNAFLLLGEFQKPLLLPRRLNSQTHKSG